MRRNRKIGWMRAPVDEADRVNNGGGAPDFTGKTPEQIAEYYADREQTILENARRLVNEARTNTPPTPGNNPPPPPPNNETVSREEFNRMTQAAQVGLISMAKLTASAGKPHWARLEQKVAAIVNTLPLEQQINAEVWSEAYFNVLGRNTETIVNEARNSALGLEPVSPPPVLPTPPRILSNDEKQVIGGLGITDDMYRDADKKLAEGFQPFTTDNRRAAR